MRGGAERQERAEREDENSKCTIDSKREREIHSYTDTGTGSDTDTDIDPDQNKQETDRQGETQRRRDAKEAFSNVRAFVCTHKEYIARSLCALLLLRWLLPFHTGCVCWC